jgi:hypothetical protein
MKKFRYTSGLAFVAGLILLSEVASAQNQTIKSLKVDDDTAPTTYDVNALVDLQSNNKGLLLPRVALTALNAAAPLSAFTNGMVVYNTATNGTAPNNVTPGYYYSDGAKWIRIAADNSAWKLTGNTGTSPGTNFLGTTDNQSLEFKVNGLRSGYIEKDGTIALGWKAITTLGYETLINNATTLASTEGFGNTAIGFRASKANTTGNGNASLGYLALTTNTTGSLNTAIGSQVMRVLTSGANNVGLGQNAFQALTTGSNNIAIGRGAAPSLTTGSNNILIANNASNLAVINGSDQLNIANNIFGTGLSGTTSAPAGNIGIGTAAPSNTLEVKASAANKSGLTFTNLTSASPVTAGAVTLGVLGTGEVVTMASAAAPAIATKTADYTAVATDETLLVDASGGARTITLPVAPATGKKYYIKKIDASANAVNVTINGSITIDGLTTLSGTSAWQGWLIQFNGTNWYIISRI